ncbi:MAG TPA: EAL domain-containing protein [Geminicoccaceae bacterium]|nr:EAL domain-containing protein [Geminicoccaceae bacterium]
MSLRYRIAATIFVLEAVMIAAVLWVTLGHSMGSAREQMARTDAITLRLLGDLSRVALLTEEYAELQSFIDGAQQDPRIRSVLLADGRERIVAATDLALIGAAVPNLVDEKYRYWRTVDILGAADRLGLLAVQFSNGPLIAAYRQTRYLGLSIAAIGMVLIAVVGLGMGYVLTRRLERLADTAGRVAAGETTVRVDLPGRDEVARVGGAFDSMVERLAANLRALEAARDRLIQPTEAMSEGFALWDADDRLVLCNRRYRELLGEVGAALELGTTFEAAFRMMQERMIDHDGSDPDLEVRVRARLDRHRCGHATLELPLRDGRWIGVSEFRTPDGGTVGIYSDVTRAKEREQALQLGEQRLRAIMNSIADGIIAVGDEGLIESLNPAAARIFGRREGEAVGLGVADLIAGLGGVRRDGPRTPDAAAGADAGATVGRGGGLADLAGRGPCEMVGVRRDGTGFPIEMSVTEIELHGRRMFIGTVRDITDRKAAEEMILYQASHDPLTGLPNRALFDDRLRSALDHARRSGERVAVLFLDLDRFKVINDTLGHATGDALLKALSGRLRAVVRKGDMVARMGGDEFLFVLPGIQRAEDVVKPTQHLLEALRAPFHVQEHELHVSASIGVSVYPADGDTPDALLKNADIALYRAKARGRNTFQLYSPTMNARAVERMALENGLRRALEREQLALVYQPQLDLASGRVVGFEALLRWRHPKLGPVPPEQFVPLAEESGLIQPLGEWVLRTACEQHRAWRRAGLPRLRIAVNMSGRQFQRGDLARGLGDLLAETAMEPQLLELELTESILMQEGDQTASVLGALAEMGVRLALDDFGTGYSSLGYLKRFPIARVKIDRSFVRDINTRASDAALARAIIAMTHGLNLPVIAEGVETAEQLALLRAYRCDEVQGYLIGRPVVPARVPALVAGRMIARDPPAARALASA